MDAAHVAPLSGAPVGGGMSQRQTISISKLARAGEAPGPPPTQHTLHKDDDLEARNSHQDMRSRSSSYPGPAGEAGAPQAAEAVGETRALQLQEALNEARAALLRAEQTAEADIEALKAQQRRELQFVKQGAEKVRQQAASDLRRLRDAQEKAVARAVREAEERGAEALARQRAEYESQLAALRAQLSRLTGNDEGPGRPSDGKPPSSSLAVTGNDEGPGRPSDGKPPPPPPADALVPSTVDAGKT